MINVFIVGSKGIPARYGGFETFVEDLVSHQKNNNIKYYVSCVGDGKDYDFKGATCFNVPIKKDSAKNRMFNVFAALKRTKAIIKGIKKDKNRKDDKFIVYILGCRVGVLFPLIRRWFRKNHVIIAFNPDGMEWMRTKWNFWQTKIVEYSESQLIKSSNYLVCDSQAIREYIKSEYGKDDRQCAFIAYGVEKDPEVASPAEFEAWAKGFQIEKGNYYLVVGRFVPENNYELIISEFMKSKTSKPLVIITNHEGNNFYNVLKTNLKFENDKRIKFVGTVYDHKLLAAIRANAFAYIHGHSVGGTNPSLLEALSLTKINLLFDVVFNREVGEEECMYFSKDDGSLSSLIDNTDANHEDLTSKLHPKSRIEKCYGSEYIAGKYERFFEEITNGVK